MTTQASKQMDGAVCIKDLKPGATNFSLPQFIVLEVGARPATTKDGIEIRTCKIADRTACINLSVWGELGQYIQPGDICRLTKGYVAVWKNTPTVYVGKGGELARTSDFTMIFNETLNMSDPAAAAPSALSVPTAT